MKLGGCSKLISETKFQISRAELERQKMTGKTQGRWEGWGGRRKEIPLRENGSYTNSGVFPKSMGPFFYRTKPIITFRGF